MILFQSSSTRRRSRLSLMDNATVSVDLDALSFQPSHNHVLYRRHLHSILNPFQRETPSRNLVQRAPESPTQGQDEVAYNICTPNNNNQIVRIEIAASENSEKEWSSSGIEDKDRAKTGTMTRSANVVTILTRGALFMLFLLNYLLCLIDLDLEARRGQRLHPELHGYKSNDNCLFCFIVFAQLDISVCSTSIRRRIGLLLFYLHTILFTSEY